MSLKSRYPFLKQKPYQPLFLFDFGGAIAANLTDKLCKVSCLRIGKILTLFKVKNICCVCVFK